MEAHLKPVDEAAARWLVQTYNRERLKLYKSSAGLRKISSWLTTAASCIIVFAAFFLAWNAKAILGFAILAAVFAAFATGWIHEFLQSNETKLERFFRHTLHLHLFSFVDKLDPPPVRPLKKRIDLSEAMSPHNKCRAELLAAGVHNGAAFEILSAKLMSSDAASGDSILFEGVVLISAAAAAFPGIVFAVREEDPLAKKSWFDRWRTIKEIALPSRRCRIYSDRPNIVTTEMVSTLVALMDAADKKWPGKLVRMGYSDSTAVVMVPDGDGIRYNLLKIVQQLDYDRDVIDMIDTHKSLFDILPPTDRGQGIVRNAVIPA